MTSALPNTPLDILRASPLMAVVTIEDAADAAPMAAALVRGGVCSIEVTLRTAAALQAIERIAGEVPEALVGAGTVVTPRDLEAVIRAGATFAISPGATDALIAAGQSAPIPYIPAVATASEIMRAGDAGFTALKLFPAEQVGGIAALKAFGGPFSGVTFCPTGGVSPGTCAAYLAQPNVACVGGSWLAPKDALAAKDWSGIEETARRSIAIARGGA